MKYGEVLGLRDGLKAIGALPLAVRVADRLSKLMLRVDAEARRIEGLRYGLFEKHGDRRGEQLVVPEGRLFEGKTWVLDPGGGQWRSGELVATEAQAATLERLPERKDVFQTELAELLAMDSELVVEPCLSIEELGDSRVTAADLARCRAIIKDA